MKRLKVLFITAWYPTKEQPVAGMFVREHAKAVRLYDDVVILHCAGLDPNLKGLWRLEQETDESLTEGIPTYRVWYRRSPVPKTSYLVYLRSVLQSFRRIAAQGFRPDIIHAHVYKAGVPAVLTGKFYRLPTVITEHYTVFPMRTLSKTEVTKARLAFTFADRVCTVSQFLLDAIQSYGIKAEFKVVPNVINTQLFYSKKKRPNSPLKDIAYISMLSQHRKGLDYLLRALGLLREKRSDFHLHVIGEGPLREYYENLVRVLGLEDFVTFYGRLPTEQSAALLRKSHLFVLPSLFENFSVATAEAMATGTPVLATRCGGPEEFVTDDVGLLVPPGDAEALYKGLDYMLDHLERFSPDQISRYVTERFSPERVGAQLHTIYQELWGRKG
jgi:glycosyltransferase involved in cell wall biosynthesis